MKIITFNNNQDAIAVSRQLTEELTVNGNEILFPHKFDKLALELAAGLLGIEYKIQIAEEQDEWKAIEQLSHNSDLSIWVGCLAAYNHGYLHGIWISIEQDEESIRESIDYMLSWSPVRYLEECEEWDIMDTDGDFDIRDLSSLAELGEAYSEHGDAYLAYLDIFSYDPSVEDFEDRYHGEYESELDYTYEYVDSTGMLDSMPENLQGYFDYQSFSRDLFISDLTFHDGHVFCNH